MNERLDLSGQRFGRLTALSFCGAARGNSQWRCQCDCGSYCIVQLGNLRSGHTKSCGCDRSSATRNQFVTHGHTTDRVATRTYKAWSHAKSRCNNPADHKYVDYGGRGISMCPQWMRSFEEFLSDMGGCPAGHTLDRVDTNGNYEPSNCRWATPAQQARNKRNNIWVEYNGTEMILKDFARLAEQNYGTLYSKLRRGQVIEKVARVFRR